MSQQRQVLLRVEDLSVAFRSGDASLHRQPEPKQQPLAVNHLSFEIYRGETLALVGESGSGKSVTAQAIMRLLPYPMAYHPSGRILFENRDLLQTSQSEMRSVRGNRIGMIFQEPMTALNPLHSIEKQIGEVICLHRGINRTAARPLILELLRQVQLPNPESRLNAFPHQLSGGQRQRVMIAMALANEPYLLIADEPTTALDVTVQREILQLLDDLQRDRDLSVLMISHDLAVVRQHAQRMVVMQKGASVESGEVESIFQNPRHGYTRELIYSDPGHSPVPLADDGTKPLLRVTDLNVRFVTKTSLFGRALRHFPAVTNASISLAAAETLGIVGESGSGKSTMAMAILRLIESTGKIEFQQQDLQRRRQRDLRPLRRHLQIVFQDPFASLSPRMTIASIVSEGLELHENLSSEEREQRVIDVLREVDLDPQLRHRYPHEFSGGQRQRIAIARALILNPQVLILDEPTSALDRSVQLKVLELLRRLQADRRISYLFISHDLQVVRALSHRVMVMKDGQIVESGTTEEIFNKPRCDYTRSLIEASYIVEPG